MNARLGLSYTELAIVAVIVAIMLVVALPDEESTVSEQGRYFTQRFEGDVSYARSLTIAMPDDPIVIKVDGANNRYWLARASDPDTPIMHPWTGEPYLVQCGPDGPEGLESVSIVGIDFGGDDTLSFDALGSTDQVTPAVIQVASGDARYETSVAVAAAGVTTNCSYTQDLSGVPGAQTYGPEQQSSTQPALSEGGGTQSMTVQSSGSQGPAPQTVGAQGTGG